MRCATFAWPRSEALVYPALGTCASARARRPDQRPPIRQNCSLSKELRVTVEKPDRSNPRRTHELSVTEE
jgi:hypothetical protein